MPIPVNEPDLTGNEEAYLLDALRSGWISGGAYLDRFEREFSAFLGMKHGIATVSGTSALALAVAALHLEPGEEVILPALTIISPVFAVCQAGATPVLVDVDPDTGNMDPDKVEAKCTPRTRAILPVHLYGHPVDMDPILEIAARRGLVVIEDAAESHGALYKGRRVGSFGLCSCWSFYPNKLITTGEGGMVTTSDDSLASTLRSLRNLGHSPQKRFLHDTMAHALRMTNLQAALGVAQLERIEASIRRKREMTALYSKALDGIPGLRLPMEKPFATSVYWMYTIHVEDEFGCSRDDLMRHLASKGIETRTVFEPMHRQPVLLERGLFGGETYPVSERLADQGLYLPSGLALKDDQILEVADTVRRIQREVS